MIRRLSDLACSVSSRQELQLAVLRDRLQNLGELQARQEVSRTHPYF